MARAGAGSLSTRPVMANGASDVAGAPAAASGSVTSGSATGNTIKLQVSGASSAATITYLKGLVSWQQANLLYGTNGIAALTFCEVPIQSGKASR